MLFDKTLESNVPDLYGLEGMADSDGAATCDASRYEGAVRRG